MAVIIFKLRFVPDDEADDIRRLLTENHIDYYETSPGILGMSMPAIWLKDESQLEKARHIIQQYQNQRQENARKEYVRNINKGTPRTFIDIFKEAPLQYISYLIAIALVIYFTVVLFISLDGD